MLLKKLIKSCPEDIMKIDISGLAIDSRNVKKGNIFFALKGSKLNGEKFITNAIKKGAGVIVISSKKKFKKNKTPILIVKNMEKTLSTCCNKFYKKKPKNIIAVTGTNGKTSVADFFYQIMSLNNMKAASIGTLGIKSKNQIKKTKLTSPNIISLHKELEILKKNKIENVIIEASSHGLKQGRLNGLKIKAGIFTNFSQDHLDYHKNMKDYFNSKMILFNKLLEKNKYLIVNKKIKEFSILKKIADKKKLNILNPKEDLDISDKLIGSFQSKNLALSCAAASICGLKNKKIVSSIKNIKKINGRLELIRVLPNKAKIFIDYAHTPEALEVVIKSLRNSFNKDVALVFGCGGERDYKKRALMAKIARKYCKKIYITDDNPRNENPKKIRLSLISHLKNSNYFEVGNREKAIKLSIKNSEPSEIILIAGKGHELTQDYGNKIINISDRKIVKRIKLKSNYFNTKKINFYHNSKILKKIIKKKGSYNFQGVKIDSRKIKKDNLFIAINGKTQDGHKYVGKANKRGANYCIVSKKNKANKRGNFILVNNTNTFLNRLAEEKRKNSNAKIIAVTGSAGKTSVKTLLGKLLNLHDETYFSPKSFNNHFGVPISLCNLENNHKYGVLEVGMSKKGEIDKLSKLIKPNIAIITNIGEAHIENFKNIKEIARAKSEIINNITKDGTVLLNKDDNFFKYLSTIAKRKKINVISFGINKKSDIFLESLKKINETKLIKIKAFNQEISFKTKYSNIVNILCSIGVLKILNLDLKKIQSFFRDFNSLEGRGKVHVVKRYNKNFKLIDESYNANPLSVKNAIKNLNDIKKKNFKKYLLLGDMLELGNKSEFYHKKISQIINKTDIDKVFVFGNKSLNTFKHVVKKKQGNILQSKGDFDEIFSKLIKAKDHLMIKGSNATGLNKLTGNLIRGSNSAL